MTTAKPFMDHTHPDAFVDFTKMALPVWATPDQYKECPRCKGHGGWNLQRNAYSLHNYADTAENRHRYSHFCAMCGHCKGWGFVSVKVTCPGHEWVFDKNLGRCYNRYRCTLCSAINDVDSSD